MGIARIVIAVWLFSIYFLVEFRDEEGRFNVRVVYVHAIASGVSEKKTNCCWFRNGSESFVEVFAGDLCETSGYEAGFMDGVRSFREFDFVNELGGYDVCVCGSRYDGESSVLEVSCHFAVL